ncbi:MAG: hypothetical protein ABI277_00045 [Burkholderiaceae bacterium]
MQASSKLRRVGLTIAALALVTTLASCGGSDNGTPAPVTPVASDTPPASASASTLGFIAFLKTVVVTMPETTQPLDLTNFVAPTDDTGPFDTTI